MVSKEAYHAADICTLSLVDRMRVGSLLREADKYIDNFFLFAFCFACVFFSLLIVQPVSICSNGLHAFRNQTHIFFKGTLPMEKKNQPNAVPAFKT